MKPLARYALALSLLAAVSFGVAARAARSDFGRRLDAGAVRDAVHAALSDEIPSAARAWLADRVADEARAELAGDRDEVSLRGLTTARVDVVAVPAEIAEAVDPLRERLEGARTKGETRVTVLSAAATRDTAARLADAGWRVRSASEFEASFGLATALALGAWLALGAFAARRAVQPGATLGVLGVGAALSFLGLTLQTSAVGPLTGDARWLTFAGHLALGCVAAMGALGATRWLATRRLPEAATDGRLALLGAAALLGALAAGNLLAGRARPWIDLPLPGDHSVQPMEWIKVLLVVGAASFVGRYSHHLRPNGRLRSTLLALAGLAAPVVLAGVSGLVFADYGVAAIVGLALAGLVLSLAGNLTLAAALVAGTAASPWLLASLHLDTTHTAGRRIAAWMWPYANGLRNGDHVLLGLRALARGGMTGQGMAQSRADELPEAASDLVLPYLCQTWGWVGVVVALGFLTRLAVTAFRAGAAPQRLPERRLLPVAIGHLLTAQVAVATLGVVGILPQTGVVTPFLSLGGTAMLTWILLIALVSARAGEGAAPVVLDRLVRGVTLSALATAAVALAVAAKVLHVGVIHGGETLVRAAITEDSEGKIRVRRDPVVEADERTVSAQRILDGKGRVLRGTDGPVPTYPGGAAVAGVVGVSGFGRTPYVGTLEHLRQARFSVFPRRPLPVQPLFVCATEACGPEERQLYGVVPLDGPDRDRLVAEASALGDVRVEEIWASDLSALATAARLEGAAREAELARVAAAVRDVQTTLDLALSQDVHALLKTLPARVPLAAVVVLDADTGHVLVQTSTPSADPEVVTASQLENREFDGRLGKMADHTTRFRGPPGSAVKALLAAAVRAAGLPDEPVFCTGDADIVVGGERTHVHCKGPHGRVDTAGALSKSCNLWAATQAGRLGSAAFGEFFSRIPGFTLGDITGRELAHAGYGQGDVEATPMAIALGMAAIASEGDTAVCERLAYEGEPVACEPVDLVASDALPTVRRGMRAAVTGGTARAAREPDGALWKVYAKTSTAEQDAVGKESGADHAWLAGFYEGGGRRYAFAILVARGGSGAATPLGRTLGELLERHGYLPSAVAARE